MRGTSAGIRSGLPDGEYIAAERIREDGGAIELYFIGVDGRSKTFRTASWPVRELHRPIVEGIAAATGFSGSSRTERSASNLWTYTRRFLVYLDTLSSPPKRVSDITPDHLRGYEAHTASTSSDTSNTPVHSLRVLRIVFANIPTQFGVSEEVLAYFQRRRIKNIRFGVSGFSDQLFNQILRAARSDVVAIRQRIRAGRELARRYEQSPDAVPESLQPFAGQLAELLKTGWLGPRGGEVLRMEDRLAIAKHVYLVGSDLAPMLILLAAVSGRNSETLKELPAEHSILDNRAIRLQVIKRRQGMDSWFEQLHWEIGKPSREVHKAGGIYRLYNELCEPGRRWANTDRLWVIWTNPRKDRTVALRFPWEQSLQGPTLDLGGWAKRHGLVENGEPLDLSFNRIRTTYLRRETREVGGHMPSAAKQNTQDVLFKNYLAGDTTTRGWAEEIITATFAELEDQVRTGRATELKATGGRLGVLSPEDEADTAAYLSCRDIEHGPHTPGEVCGASALACFSCPNALVGEQHLGRLIHLKGELESRWDNATPEKWWAQFGRAWIALNDDILPRFSAAEINSAAPDTTVPLSLLEDSW